MPDYRFLAGLRILLWLISKGWRVCTSIPPVFVELAYFNAADGPWMHDSDLDKPAVLSLAASFTQRPVAVLKRKMPLHPKQHYKRDVIKTVDRIPQLHISITAFLFLLWILDPWWFYICKTFIEPTKRYKNLLCIRVVKFIDWGGTSKRNTPAHIQWVRPETQQHWQLQIFNTYIINILLYGSGKGVLQIRRYEGKRLNLE